MGTKYQSIICTNFGTKAKSTSHTDPVRMNLMIFSRMTSKIWVSALQTQEYPKYILKNLGPQPIEYRKQKVKSFCCTLRSLSMLSAFENKGQNALS